MAIIIIPVSNNASRTLNIIIEFKLMFFYCYLEVDSIFKTSWDVPHKEWFNQQLGDLFNVVNTIRYDLQTKIDSPTTGDYEISIHVEQSLYDSLKVPHTSHME